MRIRKGWAWLLLATLTVSTIGDEITLITLMFRTAAEPVRFAVPMLLVAELLPGLLVLPFAGRLVDTCDAGRVLVAEALACAAVIGWMAFHPDLASTLFGAAVLSVLFAIGGTASFAMIPVVAARLGLSLPRANALLEFVRSAGMLAGPVAGGALVAWGGTANALLIDAASFLMLALVVLGSGMRRPGARQTDEGDGPGADYRPVLRDRRIMVVIGTLTLGVYASAIADVAFVFLVTVTLAAGPVAFGMLTACWAGGMMTGAMLAGRGTMARSAQVAFAAAGVMGVAMLAIGAAGAAMLAGSVLVGVAFVVGGGANSVHNVAVRTMLQRAAPAEAHGRVAALYSGATNMAGVVGYVSGGLFVPDRAAAAYLTGGVIGIIAAGAGWALFDTKTRAM